jgi:AraC-like DNA-binding protein
LDARTLAEVYAVNSVRSLNASNDPREAASLVAGTYFPHEMRVLGRSVSFGMRLQASNLGPVTVGMLGWGADVSIDCNYPGSFEINIPLSGKLESEHHGRAVTSLPGQGTVFAADQHSRITLWSEDCVVVGVKLDRDHVLREFRQMTGKDEEIHLPDQLDFSQPRWQGWLSLVRIMPGQFAHTEDLLGIPIVKAQLSAAISNTLVAGLAADLPADSVPTRPRPVKRLQDALHADPARSWTLGDMAELAGVSGRRLQQSFQALVGMTPTEYLRDLRLERVHHDLMEQSGKGSVGEIAGRWGFVHAGRFSRLYRQKYGRMPSDMLRISIRQARPELGSNRI